MPNSESRLAKAGLFKQMRLKMAGVVEEVMRLCPQGDCDSALAVADLMILAWLYQTALFALVAHQLWASPGQIRPELVIGAIFIATFIMFIDAYMIMRAGWYHSGLVELKRGGLDISGELTARIKTGISIAFRIMLSVGLAQLTAIFVSLLIFAPDINAPIQAKYLEANAHLVGPATTLVDAEMQRATMSVVAQTDRVTKLSGQVASLRQLEIDPSANDPQVQQAQREVDELMARKAGAEDDVRNAETSVANELGGMNGARAGRGLRWRAAMDQLENARTRVREITRALNAARERLDVLRKKIPPPDERTKQRGHDQLLAFETALDTENMELARLKDELAKLTHGREQAIRHAIESAPDHVAADDGFLARIAELERIAQKDTKILLVIILIDGISFALELAAVLAKATSYVPTTYAALLARDAYLRSVRIVDEMMTQFKLPDLPPPEAPLPSPELPRDSSPGSGSAAAPIPSGPPAEPASPPPKRPRGRPRKNPLNVAVTISSGPEAQGQLPGQPEPA